MRNDSATGDKQRAALFSLLAALGLTVVKLAAGLHADSLGILSEALHSALDLLAAGLTLLAVRISARPPDADHAYGHGKAENLSALAQTLLLFLTCGWITWEAVHRLLSGASPTQPSLWGVGVMLLSMSVDINRVRVLRRAAKKHHSQALEADALHFSTDILSSAIVLCGVLVVYLADLLHAPAHLANILAQADSIAALLVAAIILVSSVRMATAAVNILMDAAPTDAAAVIRNVVLSVPGVLEIHGLRIRRSGAQYFVELNLGVLPQQMLEDAHTLGHAAVAAVRAELPQADVTVHVEPQTSNIPQEIFSLVRCQAGAHGLRVHHIHVSGDQKPTHLEFHVELPASMDFATAYRQVKALEESLKPYAPDMEIFSHLEPEQPLSKEDSPIPIARGNLLQREVRRVAKNEHLVRSVQNISIFEYPELGTSLAFSCLVPQGLTVQKAHTICKNMEHALFSSISGLGYINIHLEPED
ncbi:MAG: cation diffusion facilitator family transporter [Desulfovibrio sp.]|nr:cation diffusion facilitator family transporter [Desulfovibrio sp.]